ncbi:hypothetical protein E5676_scaffold2774G00090 [Cucumis melo var. makuwa]|uniref:Uncharacterized protein n=1 Tax=Cucumis melo var. makuwa TaxID=1194695 RepID=A0A5A7VC74_CUCMM|nr:hypothetical protein E6C27_scaffold205G00060 [Cucumis melo var. makuwa]TYK23494.1 hypothetical protein E5676_scaffold2774G00090 [Cucumis melo var. makuwa]
MAVLSDGITSFMRCYVYEWSDGVTYSLIVLSVPSGSLKTSFILCVPLGSLKTRCVPMESLDCLCLRTRQFRGNGKGRGKLASDREGSVTCHMGTQFCFHVYVLVFQYSVFSVLSLQETGVLPTHKIVEKGYADIFCGVGPYVGKTESKEAFPTLEQHGIGNAYPDVVFPDDADGVENTSPNPVYCDRTAGVRNVTPDHDKYLECTAHVVIAEKASILMTSNQYAWWVGTSLLGVVVVFEVSMIDDDPPTKLSNSFSNSRNIASVSRKL